MKNLKKKTAAEEEIKEETSVETPETEEKAEEVVEEVETTEEAPAAEEEAEGEKITLDSGAVVDESAHPEADKAESLVTITKEDGTEIFVEKVESEDEAEKKEIYEAIVEADSEDAAEEVSEEVLKELEDEEIDEVNYIPAGCKTHFASLNNSFYVVKTKAGKIKAFKAGKILDSKTKAELLSKIKAGKKTEDEITVFAKVASKIGNKLSSFVKLASKKVAKKHMTVVGDVLKDPKTGKDAKVIASKKTKNGTKLVLNNGSVVDAKKVAAAEAADDKKALEMFNIDTKDLPQSKVETSFNIEEKELDTEDVKSSKSKVKEFYGKLPNKSGVGTEPEWYLKDFNQTRNKTVASQVKALRDVTKALHEAKEVIASKDETIKQLQAKLDTIEAQKKVMLKNQKISKITASMNLTEAEDIRCATKRLASYSDEQLDAIYETINLSSSLVTDLVHEQEANEQMKKEASMNSYVPGIALSDSYGSNNEAIDYVELLKQKELNKYN